MSFLKINTNTASISARRHLENSTQEMQIALERLASGERINHASDDVAGLAISEIMKGQIKGLGQAERNVQDAVSLVQVAEGGLSEVNNILVRMRELAIQASSESVSDKEREFINFEVQQLKEEVDRIANSVELSGKPLLNGEGTELSFQVGLTAEEHGQITFDVSQSDVRTGTLGIDGISVESVGDARSSLEDVDAAITSVVQARAVFGAAQSRFNSTLNNLSNYSENLSAANARIRDANIAEETSRLVKSQILTEAGMATLSQANMNASRVLKLIG